MTHSRRTKPNVVYLSPDESLPEGRPPYLVIERDPDGSFAGVGHGLSDRGDEEIYSEDFVNLDDALKSACAWAVKHKIDTVHVRLKVKGWEYES